MSSYPVGCYVTHAKLSDLGSGEVTMVGKGAIRIRFASGERNFDEASADPHLQVTAAAPVMAAAAPARKRAARKPAAPRKTAARKAPAAVVADEQ